MAIPTASGSVWEIRTTGGATNGGGFYPGGSGTDYSQQDAPVLALTDLSCNNSTTVTSATGGFTANMVNNLAYIGAGSGFTAGWYRIVTYTDSTTVILDRNPTTGVFATGGTCNVGGALTMAALLSTSFATQFSNVTLVWVAPGTHTPPVTMPNWTINSAMIGYGSTGRGSRDVWPVIDCSGMTAGTNFINMAGGAGGNKFSQLDIRNPKVSAVGAGAGNAGNQLAHRLIVRNSGGLALHVNFVQDCYVENAGAGGISCQFVWNSRVRGWASASVGIVASSMSVNCIASVASPGSATSQHGFQTASGINCVAVGVGADGFQANGGPSNMLGCIASRCGRYGFNHTATDTYWDRDYSSNFAHACTSGNNLTTTRLDLVRSASVTTLSADPFSDYAAEDFRLNSAAGGGLVVRGAGWPQSWIGYSYAGHPDGGAVQAQASAGGGLIRGIDRSGGYHG